MNGKMLTAHYKASCFILILISGGLINISYFLCLDFGRLSLV